MTARSSNKETKGRGWLIAMIVVGLLGLIAFGFMQLLTLSGRAANHASMPAVNAEGSLVVEQHKKVATSPTASFEMESLVACMMPFTGASTTIYTSRGEMVYSLTPKGVYVYEKGGSINNLVVARVQYTGVPEYFRKPDGEEIFKEGSANLVSVCNMMRKLQGALPRE